MSFIVDNLETILYVTTGTLGAAAIGFYWWGTNRLFKSDDVISDMAKQVRKGKINYFEAVETLKESKYVRFSHKLPGRSYSLEVSSRLNEFIRGIYSPENIEFQRKRSESVAEA